jgi:hypothetical protein
MINRLDKKTDIIIGVRPLMTIHKGPRKYLSFGWNLLAKSFLGLTTTDTQCGFKLFSKHASKLIFADLESKKWLFDMEVLVAADYHSLKTEEIEISDWRNQPGGSFNKQIVRDSFATFSEFISIYKLKKTKYKNIK